MKAKLFIALLFIVHCSLSQWSTSTKAESALFVCPGFTPSILTFDDGSSIICGALNDYRFVQKLDPYGYKIWQQPVQVYYTPGTNSPTGTDMISDGDGGVILWWGDHRGAEPGPFGYFNNAIYGQRVDKHGQVRWQAGGIQFAPVDGGLKGGYGVADGQGGITLYMSNSDFLRTGASNKAWTWLVRYDSVGKMVWRHDLDSSDTRLPEGQPQKIGNLMLIQTLSGLKLADPISGAISSSLKYIPRGNLVTFKDSVGYAVVYKRDSTDSLGNKLFVFGVTQISPDWDSTWYSEYQSYDEADNGGYAWVVNSTIANGSNGIFDVWTFRDKAGTRRTRAQWTTKSGPRWPKGGINLPNRVAGWTFSAKNKLGIYFRDGTAQAIDSAGNPLWDSSFTILSDPENAYAQTVISDNNGGAINTFWTTVGGIYAQHTGRVGRVGVITKIPVRESSPLTFALQQNYPNPFNSMTTIQFTVGNEEAVALAILDLLGREVQILVREKFQPGDYRVRWDASGFASGVYFCRLSVNERALTKKVMLLR